MGKPGWGHAQSLWSEYIGPVEVTGGIETSQYPEERKATATPLVAASEEGRDQTVPVSSLMALLVRGSGTMRYGIRRITDYKCYIGERLRKGSAEVGNSPVSEMYALSACHPK